MTISTTSSDDDDGGGATIRLARGFTQVPNGVIAADISATAFRVYVAILSYGRGNEATAFPKRETVCERFGISPRSFSAAIKELQDRGFLVISKRSYAGGMRRSNVYFFPDVDDGPSQGAKIAPGTLPESAPSTDTFFALPEEEDSFKNTKEKKTGSRTGTTAIPRGWQPTPAVLSWAKEKHPRIDVSRETVKFINYFVAKGTRYKDWEQAFRNWMDRADEYQTAAPRLTAVPEAPRSAAFAKEMGWA